MNTKTSGGNPAISRARLALSLCLTMVMAILLASGTAAASKAIDYEVTVGKSAIITLSNPVARVSVTAPNIADVVAISPTEVQINGISIGSTSLIIWDKSGKKTFFDVNVVGDNTQLLERIHQIAPGDKVDVSVMKDMIIITGTVSSYERQYKIKHIADEYKALKDAKYQIINLVEVAEMPQVLLQVTVASIDRSATKNLGINWSQVGQYGMIFSTVGSAAPISKITDLISGSSSPSTTQSFGNNPNFGVIDAHNGTAYMLKALSKKGLAKILAEPNLIVKSGETGTFLAGGSIPIPLITTSTAGSNTGITVEYKEFGVRMNFSPVVKENGVIVLGMGKNAGISKIEQSFGGTMSSSQASNSDEPGIEVSSLDPANGVIISGFNIPALKVDSVRTSVDLREGESFVIAGLIRNDWSKDLQKFPILGDIPILGAFFREQTMSKDERELVFLVTPKLIKPMAPGQKTDIPGMSEPNAGQEEDLRWIPLMPTSRSNDSELLR